MPTDNKLIAAHLAAALIAKNENNLNGVSSAVNKYKEVLAALENDEAERQKAGIDSFLKGSTG